MAELVPWMEKLSRQIEEYRKAKCIFSGCYSGMQTGMSEQIRITRRPAEFAADRANLRMFQNDFAVMDLDLLESR